MQLQITDEQVPALAQALDTVLDVWRDGASTPEDARDCELLAAVLVQIHEDAGRAWIEQLAGLALELEMEGA